MSTSTRARIGYRDPFVETLYEDIGRLIGGESAAAGAVEACLRELACANSEETAAYWNSYEDGLGIPDSAYKTNPPYLFPDREPVRVFQTSMTTGGRAGRAPYSARGMDLMDMSILRSAGRHVMQGLEEPAVIRLVPAEQAAPAMVMAHGMELIARHFGNPRLSDSVLGESGIDYALLRRLVDGAVAEQRPVVLMGATSVSVNLCQTMKERGHAWVLPSGSRLVDAGGHKRTRRVSVDEVRAMAADVFGIGPGGHCNLFGMTELASQLYDGADVATGPSGERPKISEPFVWTRVRNVVDLRPLELGTGLLEVVDLCLIDRPCVVLTGDWGIAGPNGTAIVGRVANGRPRGCALALDEATTGRRDHA